jgi:phage portal protein BeeE
MESSNALTQAQEDIAKVFAVPLELIGGSKRTYENLDQAEQHLYTLAALPLADLMADALHGWAPLQQYMGQARITFNRALVECLQDDMGASQDRALAAVAQGVLTRDEARRMWGLGPLDTTMGQTPTVTGVVTPLDAVADLPDETAEEAAE